MINIIFGFAIGFLACLTLVVISVFIIVNDKTETSRYAPPVQKPVRNKNTFYIHAEEVINNDK